ALREEYQDDLLLDWADYTTESWEAFEPVLEAAGELLEDPNATDEEYMQMLADLREAKTGLVYVDPDYTVKYAVSIYDINADMDEDGNTLGLTFGPATASHSYIRDYNAHLTEEEYESGEGVCLHWMSWKDIIRQSKEDPEAFRDCMNNGCTHSIEMVLNDTLLNSNYTFNRMTGDGCGILYYSIANKYLQVDYGNGEYHNYGATTFRTTLNTASYSLLSCFPEDLQNGIVAKKNSYAQTAGSSTAEYCYDKLWLFSLYELGQGGSSVEGEHYYRPTSENVYNSESNRTYKLYNYYENGDYGDWMLPRSLYGEYDKSIYSVHYEGDGTFGTITGGGSGGLSPGFCLAGPEEGQELHAFAVYSEDDSSLTFYTDYDIPTAGSTYGDKAVTKVYRDVDQAVAESADDIPWTDVCTDATDVVIDSTFADAQPTSFAYWFDGFANAAFSGLEYMDTTNVTSMSYMFHDCSALTRLDLSDWDTTSVTDGEQFATGCTNLQRVKIGEDTNIFTLSQNVDQQDWYDNSINGNLISSNYLMDVTDAGTYWSFTEGIEGYITIKVGDETSSLSYETIDAAIANAGNNTFTCGSNPVTAKFVLLSDLIGIDYDFCSYIVTTESDESVTSGLPTDTYLYKTDDGAYRTAVDGGPESQWISGPNIIEVVVDHTWGDVEWTWTGLPVYCTTDNPDFEPLSVTPIQPWNVAESLRIATLAGDTIDATATAAATCRNCGELETANAVLTAEYLSAEPTEYVGALAEITATATFSDGQKATDAVKVLAPATGEIAVNYMRDDETVKTDSVSYANINELINQVEPFAVHYISSGGRDTELTMPFVSITDALGMSEDENFCCFYAYGTDGFIATLPADAYLYQRNEADSSGNNYYYRTAVGINSDRPIVRSSQAFVSYVARVDVQYMHQWGDPTWIWSDDYSSATVTVACTRDNGSGMVVCNYSDTADATIDVTPEGGYLVYTATATLVDGTVVTDVQRVEDTREAFAVYSADDNSLTFAYGDAPAVGGQYDGKTVTTVYDHVDSVSATSAESIPWYSVRASITDVVIDETFYEIQPISLAYWFNEFSSLQSLDLSGMDTTNVTDVDGFANGCTNLKWVKIGEKTDVFRRGQAVVDQQIWYDSDENGKVVSENYLQDINAAGQYWTYTTYEVPTVRDVTITSNVEGNSKTYDGAGFNLAVSATVTPDDASVTCQWYGPDGEAVEGATSSVFTTGGNVADSGIYKCVVTATNGTESASAEGTIEVIIEKAAQEISFEESAITKTVGDEPFTNTLIETTVDTAGGATITYTSSNESIATVDADGEVTILAVGEVTVTATASATDNYEEASAAYTLMVNKADKAALQAEYDEDILLNEDDYTTQSWAPFEEALKGAEAILTDENASQKAVDEALAALQSAKAGLQEKAAQEISFAESTITKTVGDEPFTNELIETTVDTAGGAAITYASSDEAIATVDETGQVTILAAGKVTITATVSATANYAEAAASYALTIEAAPEPTPPADKEVLETTIANAEALNKDDYTEESWNAMQTALDAAKAVDGDDDATQSEVDQATIDLVAAIADLESPGEEPGTETDKSDLLKEYTEGMSLSESDYTTESWEPFAQALAAARNVLTDPDATQDDVDAAMETLKTAMDNLKKSGSGGEPKNGLCRITSGELWGYYVDDKVDTSYTGFAHNDNGDWWVVNGYVRFDTNSVEKDTTGKNGDKGVNEKGAWWYVIGSKVQHNFTGLANYKNVNGW
ncbi:MAG: Ig-like domain-containing protein, partial [Bacteroidales bacterium]|nr:Ig-like domain-containing protein [Bacteroidales bacterium]